MLIVEHKAPHLFREEAYREYCYSVDAYGSYQPGSFIYLCFESFSNLCLQSGLKLVNQESNTFKNRNCKGMIIRIINNDSVKIVNQAIDEGKNVIALLPNEMIGCWYNGNEDMIKEAINAAEKLNVKNSKEKIKATLANRDLVWFEEINTNKLGRLFIVRDAFLSDGYFLDGYGKTQENTSMINLLLKNFITFKYPVLRVEVRNNPPIWLTNEPISIVIDIINYGSGIEYVELSIQFPDFFEPMSSLERVITNLENNKKVSIAFKVVPRTDGVFKDFININLKTIDNREICTCYDNQSIEIYPSYESCLKNNKSDDESMSKLMSACKMINFYDDVKNLPQLVEIDISSCLNRIRKVSEKICDLLLENRNLKVSGQTFVTMIKSIQENNILSSKSIGYLHTVRTIGNIASHPSDEDFSDIDVRVASYALSCVIEEIVDKNIKIVM